MTYMRRQFLKISLIIFICLTVGIGIQYGYNHQSFTLNLVHTNDLHAHLIPFHPDNRVCDYQSADCRGGFARIKTLIDDYRTKHPDMVLLDAGDRFSGTVFYTLRKGQDVIRLMNQWQYDAMTLGNHDFDDGITEIEKMMKQIKTPVICANAVFPETTSLSKQITPSAVIERNGRKIGIIGLLTPDVKTETIQAKEITLRPLIQTVQDEVNRLKKQDINIIILLTHIGFETDKTVAQQVRDVDIIIGGHSHTLLSNNPTEKEAQGAYPTIIHNPENQPVLIVSTGIGGHFIGELSVTFNQSGIVQTYQGNTVLADNTVTPDKAVLTEIADIERTLNDILNEPIVQSEQPISLTPKKLFCSQSCHIGEILTDSLKRVIPDTDIVILNAGSIRAGLPEGTITFQHLAQSFPFDSYGAIVPLSGKQIQAYLEHGLKKYNPNDRTNALLQTAGLSYTFNPQTKKLVSVTVNNQPMNPDKVYQVAMPSFIAGGGDGFPEQTNLRVIPESIRDLIKKAMQMPDYTIQPLENRIETVQNNI